MLKSITREEFSREIENFVASTGSTYFESLIHIIELRGIEYETVKKLINSNIKEKLEAELCELNLIKNPGPKLDI